MFRRHRAITPFWGFNENWGNFHVLLQANNGVFYRACVGPSDIPTYSVLPRGYFGFSYRHCTYRCTKCRNLHPEAKPTKVVVENSPRNLTKRSPV